MNVKIALGAALAGAFVLGASVVGFSAAQQEETQSKAPQERVSTSFSELEEDEIGEIVRAYLMENPEVIIDAVNEYSARQRLAEEERARLTAKENLAALLNADTGFVAGKNPSKATVAIIEMYDYHCTFCKRAAGLVKDMTKSDASVKVVFRELPILREESDYAAEMSLAARDQGKFLDLHFAMMDASGVLTKERVQTIARKQGLNVNKMEAAIKSGDIAAAITENHELAARMGVNGTPAFVIATTDGSYVDVVSGYQPELIQEMIDKAKNAAK